MADDNNDDHHSDSLVEDEEVRLEADNSADEQHSGSNDNVSEHHDFADQFRLMKTYLDKKLAPIEAAMHHLHEEDVPQIKRKKRVKPFQQKAHQDQHNFNEEILVDLERVQSLLKVTGKRKRAMTLLDDTMTNLRKRQKHISLADRSEGGWATVAAYLPDELASDTDDERRIRQAEKKGMAVVAERKKRPPGGNYSSGPSAPKR